MANNLVSTELLWGVRGINTPIIKDHFQTRCGDTTFFGKRICTWDKHAVGTSLLWRVPANFSGFKIFLLLFVFPWFLWSEARWLGDEQCHRTGPAAFEARRVLLSYTGWTNYYKHPVLCVCVSVAPQGYSTAGVSNLLVQPWGVHCCMCLHFRVRVPLWRRGNCPWSSPESGMKWVSGIQCDRYGTTGRREGSESRTAYCTSCIIQYKTTRDRRTEWAHPAEDRLAKDRTPQTSRFFK